MSNRPDTRQQIFDAAVERIMHYGYAKTTMAEIARDCGMSAGNIYRFFASKLDIAEAFARRTNMQTDQRHAALVRAAGSAPEKLRELHMVGLHTTFEKLASNAKILEVAEILARERPAYANEKLARERVFMVQILEQGVAEGDFAAMRDPDFVAEMIQSATMKFRFPQLFTRLTLDKLERELTGVMNLLLAGLSVAANPGGVTDNE